MSEMDVASTPTTSEAFDSDAGEQTILSWSRRLLSAVYTGSAAFERVKHVTGPSRATASSALPKEQGSKEKKFAVRVKPSSKLCAP